jgi:poly(A) polymerase
LTINQLLAKLENMKIFMEIPDSVQFIVKKLTDAGFVAYLAGGCVRDLILGLKPRDYDVVTSATPEQIMQLFKRTVSVGAQFGVVKVLLNHESYEVATFRGKSAEEDVSRRDFTINGLLYDLREQCVIDHVGGLKDIKMKLIRAIGDPQDRFEEDKLRMMRSVRLAARYRYRIEEKTFEAVQKLAHKIKEVSPERIRDELVKILTEGNAAMGIQLLQDSGLLVHILPEVSRMKGVPQPPEFHPEGDVWTHTLKMLENLQNPTPELAMGVLLHDVGKPLTFKIKDRIRFDGHAEVGAKLALEICQRLKFSNKETEKIVQLVRDHLKFLSVKKMRPSTLKRFLRGEHLQDLLELHRLDSISSHRSLENWEFCREQLASLGKEALNPPPLLRGEDLIALGYVPGPIFREILNSVEEAQLEGRISTREEALELVKQTYPREEKA